MALLPGCTSIERVPPPAGRTPYRYIVGPGDVIEISVWKEPELHQTLVVPPDGRLSLPIVGSLAVSGKTLSEIADGLAGRLADAVHAPTVTVTLKESHSAQVQVVGEVGRQGRVPFRDPISLVQAIGEAGGITWATAKLESVHIIRGPLDDPLHIAIDLEHVYDGVEKDVLLAPGDIVVVPPKHVTSFDRYVNQLFSPIRNIVGTGQAAAAGAATR
jgi:polysaccharide export outer membrane protein